MRYIRKHAGYLLVLVLLFLFFNLYYIFLIPNMQLHYLIYLDILLAVCLGIFFTIDGYFFYKGAPKIVGVS